MLVLRDGRKLIGVLRSWDQFGKKYRALHMCVCADVDLTDARIIANIVLQDTVERVFVQDLYADISRGIYLVRGENVLLLGEIVCIPTFSTWKSSCCIVLTPAVGSR